MKYILSYGLCLAVLFLPACQVLEGLGWLNTGVTAAAHKISEADVDKSGDLSFSELLGLIGLGGGGLAVTTRNLMSARRKKKAFGSIDERLHAIEEKLASQENGKKVE